MTLLWRNDNYIVLSGLRNALTGAYVNDAVLTLSLLDQSRRTISGASAISMAYVSGSDGVYAGLVASTIQTTVGTRVLANITCSNYGARWDEVEIDVSKRNAA